MPILKKEDDIWPDDLFERWTELAGNGRKWWSIYTRSRREKDLLRRLCAAQIPCYGPTVPKRYRSPNGRLRTSHIPLFPNYVFMLANEDERGIALTTNTISKCQPVVDPETLVEDLSRIHQLIGSGVPLTPEARLEKGAHVRVRTGPFAGYEGSVIRREGRTRLLVAVRFLEQGVSMEIDEGLLEKV